jgi:hypothetical protein
VTFAGLFVAVALASSWVRSSFGQKGVYVLAAITGTTDINPFVLSLAQGGVSDMSLVALSTAILIAVASNNMLNACYALVFGGVRRLPEARVRAVWARADRIGHRAASTRARLSSGVSLSSFSPTPEQPRRREESSRCASLCAACA